MNYFNNELKRSQAGIKRQAIEKIEDAVYFTGEQEKLYSRLLQDSHFVRNILGLSGIITLGNLKPSIDWHSVTVCIFLVSNNFIKNRLIGKSSDLTLILLNRQDF